MGVVVDGLIREIRPWQWYKQGIIFIPLVFSLQGTDWSAWMRSIAAALIFSIVAGGIYILNDISDVEEDRRHPNKKHRPIASGQINARLAGVFAIVFLLSGFLLSTLFSVAFIGLLAVYVIQNVSYSLALKDLVPLDIFSVAIGFVLRAAAGVVVIDARVSPWLFLTTFLTALMFATGKRWSELAAVESPTETRASLEAYSGEYLRLTFLTTTATLLIAYSLYTFFAREKIMMLTIPLAFAAVFRYGYLILEMGVQKPHIALIDRQLLTVLMLWGITAIVILYWGVW